MSSDHGRDRPSSGDGRPGAAGRGRTGRPVPVRERERFPGEAIDVADTHRSDTDAGGVHPSATAVSDADGSLDGAVQYLAPDGSPLPDADLPSVDDDTLLEIYEWLVLARRFDERALSLQRQGRIATWAPMRGQEGSQVASAVAMADGDWLYPTYRETAARLVRGTEPAAVLARLRGLIEPPALAVGERVLPESIPIGSHLPHAVGGAMASRYRGRDEAHVVHFGDGATSQGAFHEACNFAGVFDAPVVFLCHNNGWAISTPTGEQTASRTLAAKASAYGFDGVRVDGMDPLAVYEVTRRALERVRDGDGGDGGGGGRGDDGNGDDGDVDGPRPLLIEALEYRLGAHTTADDPDVYRDGVPEAWASRDPVPRFETFLRETGRLDDETVDAVADQVEETIADAIDQAEALEPDPADLFEHTYAEAPDRVADQRAALRRRLETWE